jgi:hypothetical protein
MSAEPDPRGPDGPTQGEWDDWVDLCEEAGLDPYTGEAS